MQYRCLLRQIAGRKRPRPRPRKFNHAALACTAFLLRQDRNRQPAGPFPRFGPFIICPLRRSPPSVPSISLSSFLLSFCLFFSFSFFSFSFYKSFFLFFFFSF